MLNLSAFNHNHHASRVKMVAKFIRRGIRDILFPGSALPWIGFCAAFAAANADTWATELGILNPRSPVIISSGKAVEAGTSGAVSLVGTLSTLAGAALIALLSWLVWPDGISSVGTGIKLWSAFLILISGVCGSLFDSWLGAKYQAIFFCPTCARETEKHPQHSCGSFTTPLRGLAWMNNDVVNTLCTLSASLVALLLATSIF